MSHEAAVIHESPVEHVTGSKRFRPYSEYRDSDIENIKRIPIHWQEKCVKYVAQVNSEKLADTTDLDYELEYIDIGSVTLIDGIMSTEKYSFEKAPSRARRRVQDGDTIISTVRTYLKAVARVNDAPENLVVSTGFAVLHPESSMDANYLYHFVQSDPFVERVVAQSVGVSYPAINPSELAALKITIPPLSEQRTIAAFLDAETARIDRLVAKNERLIELLAEKRIALISQAVTKGLNPDVPMKDSRMEWLGQIPAHWETRELRRLIRHGTTITYGIVQAGPDIEGGIPYIRTSDMAGRALPLDGYLRTSSEIDYAYRRSKVNTGDIVVAIRATVGKALPVPPELDGANLTQGTAKVSPADIVDRDFLLFALSSSNSQQRFGSLAKGATFREITLDMLRRFAVPFPPKSEQLRIASRINAEVCYLDRLVASVSELIHVIREYRSALISAAVTGKIDVRGFKPEEENTSTTRKRVSL